MHKLRALIVDDAAVMRRLVAEVLRLDPGIEIVDSVPNGRVALRRLAELKPDFVTLDVEMPEMDGLATLREIRREHPRLPVIMFSLATRRGAASTLEALSAGASDYVAKPSCEGIDAAIELLARDLLPKIHAHCRPPRAETPLAPPPRLAPRPKPVAREHPEILAMATSTGGPNALAAVFAGLEQPAVPIVIVQHMPPLFTAMLGERLTRIAPGLACREAVDGEILAPGLAYLAPGGIHLAVERRTGGPFVARLLGTPPENSCRPAADVLFRSIAATGARALAVVMTGMGEDGLRGCELLAAGDSVVLAQDEASSVVWGMPGCVARAGLADSVHPLGELAAAINHLLPAHAATRT